MKVIVSYNKCYLARVTSSAYNADINEVPGKKYTGYGYGA